MYKNRKEIFSVKSIIKSGRHLVAIAIGSFVIIFTSAWDWPWEETSVYGTWDAPDLTYIIEKSSIGPQLTITPRGAGWKNKVWTDEDWVTHVEWLEPSGMVKHSYLGEVSVGETSANINYTSIHTPMNNMPGMAFELVKIEASLTGTDTLEGKITIEEDFRKKVTTNRFLAGRRKK